MGLAEPRKRLKLSKDPNNTTWTKDTTGFGHKIMKSQGWQPGDYLGLKDAPHAEFHTEANASHIRVVLKDDNLGIGAKKGSGLEQGECVGLDVFQNLLGRLNGRDEDEIEREQKSREDLKRAIYTERKWGSIRFVSGGFLIGDKIQDLIDGEAERMRQLAVDSSSASDSSSDSDSDSDSETTPEPVLTKDKKFKKSKKSTKTTDSEVSEVAVESENGKTKSKKKRKLAEIEEDGGVSIVDKVKKSKKSKKSESEEDTTESKDGKSKSKKDKKEKKEKKDKKDKKDKKKKSKSKSEDSLDSDSAITSKSSKSKSKSKKSKSEKTAPDAVPVTIEISSRPILLGGRLAVRSRNIEQKRLAAMNSSSLNEIFMIKG
ncbi:hypothetical protein V494_06534 [Pseudogymnoascus sp. VKM F-4513 (FW-928)]|nr:hypothetical protein V494_06534 [Pseudogymnoascus sp. VKM F-4513 (FW-928)]